jgi:rare lipoprotein A
MVRKASVICAVVLALGNLICGLACAQTPPGFSGKASYYDKSYHGIVTAGGKYDPTKLTCAHLTLPFGTRLRVTDKKTGRSVVVTVNDRGPHSKKLVIDLSWAAAEELQMFKRGVIDVIAVVLADEPAPKN